MGGCTCNSQYVRKPLSIERSAVQVRPEYFQPAFAQPEAAITIAPPMLALRRFSTQPRRRRHKSRAWASVLSGGYHAQQRSKSRISGDDGGTVGTIMRLLGPRSLGRRTNNSTLQSGITSAAAYGSTLSVDAAGPYSDASFTTASHANGTAARVFGVQSSLRQQEASSSFTCRPEAAYTGQRFFATSLQESCSGASTGTQEQQASWRHIPAAREFAGAQQCVALQNSWNSQHSGLRSHRAVCIASNRSERAAAGLQSSSLHQASMPADCDDTATLQSGAVQLDSSSVDAHVPNTRRRSSQEDSKSSLVRAQPRRSSLKRTSQYQQPGAVAEGQSDIPEIAAITVPDPVLSGAPHGFAAPPPLSAPRASTLPRVRWSMLAAAVREGSFARRTATSASSCSPSEGGHTAGLAHDPDEVQCLLCVLGHVGCTSWLATDADGTAAYAVLIDIPRHFSLTATNHTHAALV